jgi:putative peptide zinc metalloprotease protein
LTFGDVRPEVEGIIEEVYFEEGQWVEKGTMIAKLADLDFRAELEKTGAQIEQQRARLKLLKAGNRPEEVEIARTLRVKAEERLKYALNRLEMDSKLYEQQLISRKDLEDTREASVLRENEVREAADHLRILLAGSREEELEATQAEINRLDVQRKHLENEIGRLAVRSPIPGVLVTPRMKERVGQAVKRGDLLAQVNRTDIMRVEIAVSEKEIADVKPGQRVILRAKAFPLQEFEGTVVGIAPSATPFEQQERRDPRTIRVVTELENRSGLLKPEMTGHAKIYGEEKRLGEIAGRRFVRFFKVEFWSWW